MIVGEDKRVGVGETPVALMKPVKVRLRLKKISLVPLRSTKGECRLFFRFTLGFLVVVARGVSG